MQVQAYRAKDNSLHLTQYERVLRDLELVVGKEAATVLHNQLTSADNRGLVRQLMTCIETAPKAETKTEAKAA